MASPQVLLVDDDPDHRATVRILLSSEGLDVDEVSSGEEAVLRVQKKKPELLLLDFHMGGMNGLQTLLSIRQNHSDEELPILMLSAHQAPDTIADALDHGANDYISKSVHPKVLLARVRRHLHKRELEKEKPATIGEFRLESRLGEGSVSTSFLIRHPEEEKAMVCRFLKPGFSLKTDIKRRIRTLAHPRISQILNFSLAPADYLLTEYFEGSPLTEQIPDGGMPLTEAHDLMTQLSSLVAFVHGKGMLHGDLQPDNLLLHGGEAYLLDLQVNECIQADNPVQPRDFFRGHPAYQSPEQLRGEAIEARSDLYSLGAIFFFLLTGQDCFGGEPRAIASQVLGEEPPRVSELRPDGSSHFDLLVGRLLAKSVDERYCDAEQLLLNLQAFRP